MSVGKEDREYPFHGYSPGEYWCECADCRHRYSGDKRSIRCKRCAEVVAAEHAQHESIVKAMAKCESESHIISKPEDNGAREALMKIVIDTTGLQLTTQVEMLTDQILARLWMARFVIKPFE
jgi:hypothetical protein